MYANDTAQRLNACKFGYKKKMNPLKQLALAGYYGASLPARRRAAARRAQCGREPVGVLFYHRVADEFPNDWTMSTGLRRANRLAAGEIRPGEHA